MPRLAAFLSGRSIGGRRQASFRRPGTSESENTSIPRPSRDATLTRPEPGPSRLRRPRRPRRSTQWGNQRESGGLKRPAASEIQHRLCRAEERHVYAVIYTGRRPKTTPAIHRKPHNLKVSKRISELERSLHSLCEYYLQGENDLWTIETMGETAAELMALLKKSAA